MAIESLKKDAADLLQFTQDCRETFHEPDEQGIRLIGVVGKCLDNAFGNSITEQAILEGWQEAVVVLECTETIPHYNLSINLATLIALARHGAKELLSRTK